MKENWRKTGISITHKYKIFILQRVGIMEDRLDRNGVSSVGGGVQLGERQRKPVHLTESRLRKEEKALWKITTLELTAHGGCYTALHCNFMGSVIMAAHNTEWTTIESGRRESN